MSTDLLNFYDWIELKLIMTHSIIALYLVQYSIYKGET